MNTTGPNRGKIMSKEQKLKISNSLKLAHINNPDIRKRMSETRKKKGLKFNFSWKGKHLSREHKNKLSELRRGCKNPAWKGGIVSLTNQIRKCFKNRQWKSDIFTRDDFTCVLCGRRGVYLEADHYPKQFSQIFQDNNIKTLEQALGCEEFWNINNGRTLCLECHGKTKRIKYNVRRLLA